MNPSHDVRPRRHPLGGGISRRTGTSNPCFRVERAVPCAPDLAGNRVPAPSRGGSWGTFHGIPRSAHGFSSRRSLPLVWLVALVLAGCTNPIGADRITSRQAQKQLNASALVGRLSEPSHQVLHRYDLKKPFARDPAATLQLLHERACVDPRRDLLYALAELSYLHADRLSHRVKAVERNQAPDSYLAAAIYAWLYVLGDHPEPPPDPFDRRFRTACDLYNRSVALAFAEGRRTNSTIRLEGGVRHPLPGAITVQSSRTVFKWSLDEIDRFLPADEYEVHGLSVRDRQSGLGAPLIAVGKVIDKQRFVRHIPATALLRVNGRLKEWSTGGLSATLELYSRYEVASVTVGDRVIPLEGDTTAPLAYSLNDSQIWKLGSAQFFSGREWIKSGIYFTQPYEPGRIPVVFVHGTFSSPIWWAEMWNTLRSDRVLRERCQFWNFIYPSGNPVAYSAARLRQELERKVRQLDPDAKDPALRQMVVIGHSQGGLLTKLLATDTGDVLWRAMSTNDFNSLPLEAEEREALRAYTFFSPLPSVTRVIFISTPHRGSYLATSFARALAARFMSLPADVVEVSTKLLTLQSPLEVKPRYARRLPTSLDSMSVRNPWLLALADLGISPTIKAHSIIAVRGDAKPPDGDDGVVRYRSAHIEPVESELVVRSSHGCQGRPAAIEEVRRILFEHLAAADRKPDPAIP